MPAYNAEKTLEKTVQELSDVVDIKILVDDSSKDQTAALSASLACRPLFTTPTTATAAISRPAIAKPSPPARTSWSWFIPTTSTRPLLVPAMAGMVASGVYDMVLARASLAQAR
jgi:hypothetical protein